MIAAIKFAKVYKGAKIPTKRNEDACFDLWGVQEKDIEIKPGETILVETGIATAFDPKWVAIIKERSSIGSKNILLHCGVIDSGYRNSWKVCLTNLNDYTVTLPKEKAIAQFMLVPVPEYDIEEYTYEELKKIDSLRGLGGFGSTDK